MAKMYKTANGKLVDMDMLRLKNEDTIAVGNMRTNARGDELGPGGKVVRTRNEKMNDSYKLHTMVPKDDLVHDSLESATTQDVSVRTGLENHSFVEPVKQQSPQEKILKASGSSRFDNVEIKDLNTSVSEPVAKKPRGGLAASVAKPVANQSSIAPTTIKRI
jgi:hypothetical protein